MPLKQKDPGAFTIPCVIGNASFNRALCDLGASISVMPKQVYDSLSLEPLNKTSIVIDTTKRLMSSPKCRSVEVINNPARPGSNHREVNCINYR